MLERLAQTVDKDNKVKFKNPPVNYKKDDAALVDDVVGAIANNSPDIRSVAVHFSEDTLGYANASSAHQITLVDPQKSTLIKLLKGLEKNTHLVELTLCGYDFSHGAVAIRWGDLPISGPFFSEQDLENAEEARALAEALGNNTSIRVLQLFHSTFSPADAYCLRWGIEHNQAMQRLFLSESNFMNEGIKEIDEALKKNQFITHLELDNLKDGGALQIFPFASVTRKTRESFLSSLQRNKDFALKRSDCEKKLLEIERLREKLAEADLAESQQEKIVADILALFKKILEIANALKAQNYSLIDELLHQLKCAQAEFYLSIDAAEQLLALYHGYFIYHPDNKILFEFAQKIFLYKEKDQNKDNDQAELNFLGFSESSLRYKYIIRLLEGNQQEGIVKSVYAKLCELNDQPSGLSFKQIIGADRILANEELMWLQMFLASPATLSKEFNSFLRELNKQLSRGESDREYSALATLLSTLSNQEETCVAQILIDILRNKKVTSYSEVRQKTNKPIEFLRLSLDAENNIKLHQCPLGTTTKSAVIVDKVEHQVYLKYLLAQSFKEGVYHKVFDASSVENINREHSRILSASRLARLSSDYTYEEMVSILQLEYYAFPDSDKQSSPGFFSFFTSYRHRTLEKALESVFAQGSITPISQDRIEQRENLRLAADILGCIGDQERSLCYKISKNPQRLQSLEKLGTIAHQMVVCNAQDQLSQLKIAAETELDKFSISGSIKKLWLSNVTVANHPAP